MDTKRQGAKESLPTVSSAKASNPEGEQWYKARVEMITIEDNGKEKRKAVTIYVQAGNITEANKSLYQSLINLDCEVISITRSPILEVFRAV